MKKFLTAGLLASVLIANAIATKAATEIKTGYHFRPSVMSSNGYWVIQQSDPDERQVIVLYYNNMNQLVKKERRSKKNADISRNKVLRSLKRSLEEALDSDEPAWD